MKKRVLAIAMSLAMTLSLLPVSALAAETGETPEEETSTVNSIQETNSSENAENQDQELTADVEIDEDTQVTEGDSVENFVAKIGDMPYATLQGAIDAASDNATIVLQDDVVLDTCITISKTITLDLAGNKISNTKAVWDNEDKIWSLVRVEGNGNLTLTGDGTLRALENDCYAVDIVDGGQCTIENGTYVGNIHAVYVFNGSLIVNGGTFSVQQKYSTERPDEYVLNCYDANYKNKSASITVTGGTFANFDPSNCYAEGEGTNFCADGYVSVQNGDQYTVMPIEEVAVAQIGDEHYLTLAEAISDAQDGATIVLLRNTTENIGISANQDITLDLNGKTLTETDVMIVEGNLTIMDSTAPAAPQVSSDYEAVNYDAGAIVNIKNESPWGNCHTIVVQNGGQVTLLSGKIKSTGNCGIYVNGNLNPEGSDNTADIPSKLTVEGGYIEALEFGAAVAGRGAQLDISDGVIVAENNAAVAGNGTNSQNAYYGGTKINISGGTIISHITSDGYIACGIYHPQRGELNISGGTIYSDGGVGLLMRGGTATISNGVIAATGTASGKVGDSKVIANCYAVQLDGASNYYDYENTTIKIIGGMISSDRVVENLNVLDADAGRLQVAGGYFTNDPSTYLAVNHYAVASNQDGYSYMVTDRQPTEAPVIVTENVEAEVAEDADMTKEDKTAVFDVINSASVSGVADALTDPAKNEIVTKANISSEILDDPDQTVVIEIGVSVTATSAMLSGDNATVTYQVTPVATVKVDGIAQGGNVTVPNSYLSGQKFIVRLPLPAGLTNPKEVMHIADNGIRERFTGNELTIRSNWVEVSISHFSTLIVNAQETVAAKIDNTEYGTLQEAVSAAKSGDVIVLQQNCNEPITISGKSVTIDRKGHTYDDSLVSVGANCTKTVSGDRIIVTYTAPSRPSGDSGSSDSGDYLITVDRVSGGRVTVQPGRADKGDTVTITVYPNDGYELDELVVTDSRGNEIDLDARSATRFTFTMPGGKVTVEASFVREGGQSQTPQTTFMDVPASAWYYDAVEYVYENGLMSGVSGGWFAPNDTLTRAMLVQTLYAMEGRPAAASAGFADVASGDWYASAVNWAAANGVVSGVSETGFGPNNALTREQLALILYRFAQYKGYDVTGTSNLAAYADGSSVSGWAAEAMGWAVDAGLISGVGGNQIAPTGTASRAQVAQILMNFCENVAR